MPRLQPLLLAAHRPHAEGHSGTRRRRVPEPTGSIHHPWRRQTDGARPWLFPGIDGGAHRRGVGPHRLLAPGRGRNREDAGRTRPRRGAAHVLLGLARAAGIQRPVVARVHPHHHHASTDRCRRIPSGQRHDRRRRHGLAVGTAVEPHRLLGRESPDGRAAGHRAIADEYRARLPATWRDTPDSGSHGHIPRRALGQPRALEDRGPAHAGHLQRGLPVPGVRHERRGLHAARGSGVAVPPGSACSGWSPPG